MQAARGAIAQELDDASLTSSDSQAIVKLISKTRHPYGDPKPAASLPWHAYRGFSPSLSRECI